MSKLDQTIALLEKVAGQKVTLVEAKEEKETPKEKKVEKAIEKAANVAPANIEKTAAGIIPPSAIQTIQVFMDETLADIAEGVAELQGYRIDANTVVSGEDFYEKAEELQDSIKQIARMNTFVKNTIIAKKFDANLLDMIVSYKHSHATPAVAAAPAAPMAPPMDMGASVMESKKKRLVREAEVVAPVAAPAQTFKVGQKVHVITNAYGPNAFYTIDSVDANGIYQLTGAWAGGEKIKNQSDASNLSF